VLNLHFLTYKMFGIVLKHGNLTNSFHYSKDPLKSLHMKPCYEIAW